MILNLFEVPPRKIVTVLWGGGVLMLEPTTWENKKSRLRLKNQIKNVFIIKNRRKFWLKSLYHMHWI